MTAFSCAVASRRSQEPLIATAGHYSTFVLIECLFPWASKVFKSRHIPDALRQMVAIAPKTTRFLCIHPLRKRPKAAKSKTRSPFTLLIYEQRFFGADNRFTNGYQGTEFQLEDLTQAAECLQAYFNGDRASNRVGTPVTHAHDVLVCTHGVRDKCCARFGLPFLRASEQLLTEKKLDSVRLWQVSHIGGHRLAPTAIVLPEGRFYGRLTPEALHTIVTRRGPLAHFTDTHRGWSALPKPLQRLEQYLLEEHATKQTGWDWFQNKIAYTVIEKSKDEGTLRAELLVMHPDNSIATYRATLVRTSNPAYCLRASCDQETATILAKYEVSSCKQVGSAAAAQMSSRPAG